MCRLKYFNLFLRFFLVAIALALAALFFRPWKGEARAAARKAVLVELFTSEGCSSCPPADELLRRLRQEVAPSGVEVIPLGFHVDYWNSLGWEDRFSSAQFSHRQEQYARSLGGDGPYTPQMIVDGAVEFVGNNAGQAQRAIRQAASEPAPAEIALSWKPGGRLAIQIKLPGVRDKASVVLALTEDNLATKVGAGENNGRELRHAAVVRELTQLGNVQGGTFTADVPIALQKDWKYGDLRAVVFVQQGDAGKVLGAASVSLLAQAR